MEAKQPITIEIFDPPMCCPTGLCGPSIDPALLDISEAILKLKTEFDGQATVERYLLGQQPAKFVQHLEVIGRLKTGRSPRPADHGGERCDPERAGIPQLFRVEDLDPTGLRPDSKEGSNNGNAILILLRQGWCRKDDHGLCNGSGGGGCRMVQSYLQAQDELRAFLQEITGTISREVGVDFGAACSPAGGCC